MKPFCNSCGLCCARVGKMVEQAKAAPQNNPFVRAISAFPYKYDETGRCEKLDENHRCSIYDTRPDVCSIERFYDKFYRHMMSRPAFYAMSEAECHRLMAEEGWVQP